MRTANMARMPDQCRRPLFLERERQPTAAIDNEPGMNANAASRDSVDPCPADVAAAATEPATVVGTVTVMAVPLADG